MAVKRTKEIFIPYVLPPTQEVPTTATEVRNIVGDLMRTQDVGQQKLTGGVLQSANFISGKVGWSINSSGVAEFQDINLGQRQISVKAGDSIQDAIDKVFASGGGKVILRNGTHTPSTDLTLYSNIYIQGENAGSCIVDFVNNAKGFLVVGTNAYTTGTLSVTNNSQTVTGVGTTWTTAMLGRSILLGGLWYTISARASDTSITISAPYAGVTLSGVTYTIATIKEDVKITDVTIRNASSGIKIQYTNETFFKDTDIQTSVIGFEAVDSAQCSVDEVDLQVNNTSFSATNCHFFGVTQTGSVDAQAGHGFALSGCTNSFYSPLFSMNSSADGINITNSNNIQITGVFIENGGQGAELVLGNSDITFSTSAFEYNASDGLKFTATSDNIHITASSMQNNGGYGLNIAASTCDNNIIIGNTFAGNTTATYTDSGTGTIFRGNVGVSDNTTLDVLSNVATNTIIGRVTVGSGDSEELTTTQVRTLINVEDGADVTDTTNVTAAGALMESEVTNLSQVKAFDTTDYATAAQGATADTAEQAANKDTTGGYAGLTLFKLNLKNAANTVTNFLTNATTVARTWTFPDKDGTVAMTSDITGTNSGTNTGDQTNITGNAATVTTNANLTGVVTSVGNTTAIADKALAVAKIADGTDGELITWSATGVATTVDVGTATHVLTSNGVGAAPTFQAATWTVIEVQSPTTGNTVTFNTDIGTYTLYKFYIYCDALASADNIYLRVNGDATAGNYVWNGTSSPAASGSDLTTSYASSDTEGIKMSDSWNGYNAMGEITIIKPSGVYTYAMSQFNSMEDSGVNPKQHHFGGIWEQTTAISSFVLDMNGTTWASGSRIILMGAS